MGDYLEDTMRGGTHNPASWQQTSQWKPGNKYPERCQILFQTYNSLDANQQKLLLEKIVPKIGVAGRPVLKGQGFKPRVTSQHEKEVARKKKSISDSAISESDKDCDRYPFDENEMFRLVLLYGHRYCDTANEESVVQHIQLVWNLMCNGDYTRAALDRFKNDTEVMAKLIYVRAS
jgi:hypothetical protein